MRTCGRKFIQLYSYEYIHCMYLSICFILTMPIQKFQGNRIYTKEQAISKLYVFSLKKAADG